MTLKAVMTADPRYFCGSWAFFSKKKIHENEKRAIFTQSVFGSSW